MRRARTAVEVFVLANLGFLAVDVYIAHAVNSFEREPEWIPVYFSLAAPAVLLASYALRGRASRIIGLIVGWCSVSVGVAGMVFHLQSHFFLEQTIHNLVYTAPFVAPLAYTGLGLLLILDRTTDSESLEWAQWVVFLALGGYGGNFVLSLADHAQNGFFNRLEWLPVVTAALAIGFLLLVVLRPLDRQLRRATSWLLVAEVLVGVLGFALHIRADYFAPEQRIWDRFLYGAPAFAPLLFANLAVLAGIGLWAMRLNSPPHARPLENRA